MELMTFNAFPETHAVAKFAVAAQRLSGVDAVHFITNPEAQAAFDAAGAKSCCTLVSVKTENVDSATVTKLRDLILRLAAGADFVGEFSEDAGVFRMAFLDGAKPCTATKPVAIATVVHSHAIELLQSAGYAVVTLRPATPGLPDFVKALRQRARV